MWIRWFENVMAAARVQDGASINDEDDVDDDADPYLVAKEKLQQHFSPKHHDSFGRFLFWSMAPETDEPIEKFALRVQQKAEKISFGKTVTESRHIAVINKIIQYASNDLRQKLLEKEVLTLDDTTKIVNAFQAVRYQSSKINHRVSESRSECGVNRLFTNNSRRSESSANRSFTSNPGRSSKCLRCGYEAHRPGARCPAATETCRSCGKVGHFRSVCRSKSKTSHVDEKPQIGNKSHTRGDMRDIDRFSKQALNGRCNVAHEVKEYSRHTEYGVVKIYFYIDITTTFAILGGLTVVPGLVYIGDQAFNDGEFCTTRATRYFDEDSGQEISSGQAEENRSKNRQADELEAEGNVLWGQGKYREAYEKYSQAYAMCTSGYHHEARFKSSRDKAKQEMEAANLYAEGNRLYRQGMFREAQDRYQQAYDLSREAVAKKTYNSHMEEAKIQHKNQQADRLNREGDDLFKNRRQYREAYQKYKMAYDLCTVGYSGEARFKNNMNSAKSEMEAADLNAEGNRLYNQGKFEEAQSKYHQACDLTKEAVAKETYISNIERAKNQEKNQQADLLNSEGDDLFQNRRQYREAYQKYKMAYDLCTDGYSGEARFKNNMNSAKSEMEAADLNAEGNRLYNQEMFSEARDKYQQAFDRSKIDIAKETYKSNRERAKNQEMNQQADQLNSEGDDLFKNRRKYQGAYEKYKQAYNSCTRGYRQEARFKSNMDLAESEMKAANLNTEGNRLYNRGMFSEARDKYQQAFDRSKIDIAKEMYKSNREKAKNQEMNQQADRLNSEGDDLYKSRRQYREAFEKYKKAYNLCISGYNQEAKFKGNMDSAESEMKAADLNAEGNRLYNQGMFSEARSKYKQAHDVSKVSQERAIYGANIERAQFADEARRNSQADQLNREGDTLYAQGKYSEAHEKYHQACSTCTKTYQKKAGFQLSSDAAKRELDATKLNSEGDALYSRSNFSGAVQKYQQAFDKSKIDAARSRYKTNRNKAAEAYEKCKLADRLFQEGIEMFNQGKYKEAYDKFSQACDTCTSGYNISGTFKIRKDEASREMMAAALNTEGDLLFRQGQFSEARSKYQEAYDNCQIRTQYMTYKANINRSRTELQAQGFCTAYEKCKLADRLFQEGIEMFNQGKYKEAYDKFSQACDTCTSGYNRSGTFKIRRDEASREMMAAALNTEGDLLFRQGQFSEARSKYQEAYDNCQIRTQYMTYKANINRSRTELQAQGFCTEADALFGQHKYSDARGKYQKAYDKSTLESERNKYRTKQAKCLQMIAEKAWDDAWQAENAGRAEVALSKFQQANDLLQKAKLLAASDGEILRLSNACNLKIDGNQLFNEGIKSQQDGVRLLGEAKQLEQQQQYEQARDKLISAERQLSHAKENFQFGSKYDQRFVACVGLAQEQLDDVADSIKLVDQFLVSVKFNAMQPNSDQCEDTNFTLQRNNVTEAQYAAQI
ncbi:uncharacterized protein LOC129717460 isoform X2 [Wyeomyia smithii]|uniref:uncharacterized protein LOC129717460 isoform X2 n=1 Tax=Wyeomyia smithii TaxID=174621 RepID=UPI002467F71B|nr:uncharacterized protein LOC129717460 isoform X2 [Wyeomyia smithii]